MTGAVVTLIGWTTETQALTDWKGDGISMFPNTAVCVLLCGLALLLHHRSGQHWQTIARAAAGLVIVVAGLTLVEHMTGVNFGIDTLLFDRPWGQAAASAPMRMGPPASVSLLMTGTALLLLRDGSGWRGVSALLGVVVMVIATLSCVGHLYGAQQMYTMPRLTGIAMQTASMILALGVGLVMSVPEREPLRTILEPSAAGMLARRALPIIVVLAFTLGWIRVQIQEIGLVDTAFGTALRTVIEVVLLTGLLWWSVAKIRVHDQALRETTAEVRRQAAQLEAFLETAAICLHRVGPDGTILWANDAELRTFGYTRAEYIGHHIAEFHLDQSAIDDFLARLHRGEKVYEYPARIKCRDGSVKHVLIDASVLWDHGRFVHTQCFTRDVTMQKRIEQSRALQASIIEASDDAIVSKTLNGIITSWNPGAQRMFGYTEAEAVGKPIDLIIPTDRLDEEREIIARLRRGQRIDHYETIRRAKNGRLLDISLTISPVYDDTGHIIGASKIARDVSDRKQRESEQQESNRRKDEFIAILAHELRNPLAPIRHAAHYVTLRTPKSAELQRPLQIIERQVALMSRLIDDLLDVSRISRGTLELRRERALWSEIVAAAVDACGAEIQAKGHELRVHLPAEPIEVEADRERLVQVLCNVTSNAAKYTPAGGQIDLRTSLLDNHTLQVSVTDTGIGIPAGKLTAIFDLFARVDQSLERQGGLGIGLTLVRQLVELHGGTVEAHSKGIGQGSEFLFRLPIVATPGKRVEKAAEAPPMSPPLRVLVADDNEDAAESLSLLLRMAGHDVHAVFDGQAALDAAEKLRPDVALLDIGMPIANGYEVARRIREHPWGKAMYLVAITGWGQDADKQRAREAGFDVHLVKPILPDAIDRLLAALNGGPEATPESRTG